MGEEGFDAISASPYAAVRGASVHGANTAAELPAGDQFSTADQLLEQSSLVRRLRS